MADEKFEIKNLSPNPLSAADGRMLAPNAKRSVKEIDDRMRGYEKRGWLSIEEKGEESNDAVKTDNKPVENTQTEPEPLPAPKPTSTLLDNNGGKKK